MSKAVIKVLILFMILLWSLDTAFTLIGQSQGYWINFQLVNEINPISKYFLMVHPAAFILFAVAWIAIMVILVKNLRFLFASIAGVGVILGHFWGSSSWVPIVFDFLRPWMETNWNWSWNWLSLMVYVALITILMGIVLYKTLKNNKKC